MNLEAKSPFFDPKLQHGLLYIHAHSTAQLAENESGSTRTMSLMATVPRLYLEPSDRVRADSPRLESSLSLDPLEQLWRRLERTHHRKQKLKQKWKNWCFIGSTFCGV